jgi:hypothetical protein
MGIFNIFKKDKKRKMIHPELRWGVNVENEIINLKDPDGKLKSTKINEIEEIKIITTDQGPFLPDVWWKLISRDTTFLFPQGALGERKFLDEVQKLPEFDNETFIKAMVSADNNEFICWKKK